MADPGSDFPNLASLLQNYSIEVSPTNQKSVAFAAERIDPGTEVYLTWIPGAHPFRMISTAAALRRAWLVPSPHICARHLENTAQLDDLLDRLVGEAAVDRVLLVGGERAKPLGPFDSTLQVMQSGLLQKHKILRLGITGFPEGNPAIAGQVLNQSLLAKMNYARQMGLEVHIVTQFCFEAPPIFDWLKRMRAMGVNLPVRIGLAGPARVATLLQYAIRCGIGNSVRALSKSSSFRHLLAEHPPEPIMRELIAAAPKGDISGPPLGITGLHFYTFDSVERTVEWINTARGQETCARSGPHSQNCA
jgi:methylenetetrahydrofolate reductase (NADPH)